MQSRRMAPRILPRPSLPTSSLASLNSVPSSLALPATMGHSMTPLLACHTVIVAATTRTKTCILAHMAEPMSTFTRQITTRQNQLHNRATHMRYPCVISHRSGRIYFQARNVALMRGRLHRVSFPPHVPVATPVGVRDAANIAAHRLHRVPHTPHVQTPHHAHFVLTALSCPCHQVPRHWVATPPRTLKRGNLKSG
jgi:hypothetical protein